MKINTIKCSIANESREKIYQFFPLYKNESEFMPIIKKKVLKKFRGNIQIYIKPWINKVYEYCISIKPINNKVSSKRLYVNDCLVQFFRTNKSGKIFVNLHIKEISRIERWKESEEGKYMRDHCSKQYYETLQEIKRI